MSPTLHSLWLIQHGTLAQVFKRAQHCPPISTSCTGFAAAVNSRTVPSLVMQRSCSRSTKHHRKKHMQPAPATSEALSLMSSGWQATHETRTPAQHSSKKAEQDYSCSGEGTKHVCTCVRGHEYGHCVEQ